MSRLFIHGWAGVKSTDLYLFACGTFTRKTIRRNKHDEVQLFAEEVSLLECLSHGNCVARRL